MECKRFVVAALTVAAVFSVGAVPEGKHGAIDRKFGGYAIQPGSQKGTIVFVNAQERLDEAEIVRAKDNVGKELKCNFKVVKGAKPNGLPSAVDVAKHGSNVVVFIVDDSSLPPMLVAPEDRWSLVNVAKIGVELKDDVLGKRLFAARCRGEIMRAFAYVAGGGSSQYQRNMFNVVSAKDLDSTDTEKIAFDVYQRCVSHLERLGVTPERRLIYRKACEEGWAPAPTNDIQKAIWDKVHSVPKNPMKIEFDPKKGR